MSGNGCRCVYGGYWLVCCNWCSVWCWFWCLRCWFLLWLIVGWSFFWLWIGWRWWIGYVFVGSGGNWSGCFWWYLGYVVGVCCSVGSVRGCWVVGVVCFCVYGLVWIGWWCCLVWVVCFWNYWIRCFGRWSRNWVWFCCVIGG